MWWSYVLALVVGFVPRAPVDAYYPMVLEGAGSCNIPLFKVSFMSITREACTKMGGKYVHYEPPVALLKQWGKYRNDLCELNMCQVPSQGMITGAVDVWGISTSDQASAYAAKDKVLSKWLTPRFDCERLTGRPVLEKAAEVTCDVTLIRQENSDRSKLTDILPLAGQGECPWKAATVKMSGKWKLDDCLILNGTGNTDYCQFDLCYPDAKQCTPADRWSRVQLCKNEGSTALSCVINFEEGVSNTHEKASSKEKGLKVTGSVGYEYGVKEVFGAFKASLSVGGDWKWADTLTDGSTWSSTSTHSMQIEVSPGKTIQVLQLIGVCGDTVVKTRNLRAVEYVNKKAGKRTVTRIYRLQVP